MNHPYDKIYNENYVLDELEYYIKEIKYNKYLIKDLSEGILQKYIDNDNKRLKKIFRKLFIIKKRYEQKRLLIYINKWLFNINNSLKERNKSNCTKKNNKKKTENTRNNKTNQLNLKLNIKKNFHNSNSISYKNNERKKNKNNSLISHKTPSKSFNVSQLSSNYINKVIRNGKNTSVNLKLRNKNIIHKSYSMPKNKAIELSKLMPSHNKNKTPNKNKNKSMIIDFMNNLIVNEKNKSEKMKKLNIKNEETMKSVYTFSPQLCRNKKNEKYLQNMVKKLYEDNNKNNKTINMNDSYDNNKNKLDIVMEENRDNKDTNFFSRLNEYEKRRLNNLEKIRNNILVNEYKNKNMNHYNNNERYNIDDDHLLNSSYSYFYNKKRKVENILKNINEEKGITFSPKLNNEYNNKVKSNFKNLKEDILNKRIEKIYGYLTDRDKECTFHPRINDVYNTNIINNGIEVGERLLSYQEKYNENLNKLKSNYPRYSFKPKISRNTEEILNKKKLNNLKEFNIIVKNKIPNFEEKKDSLKISQNNKRFENYKINYTPSFEFSKQDKNNHIESDYFKLDKMIEYNDYSTNSNKDINNSANKKENNFVKNANKNLMSFDYYDKLI